MKRVIKRILLSMLLWLGCALNVQAATETFDFDAELVPLSYQLNAQDPSSLADFYQKTLGMTLLESDEATSYYRLGTSDKRTLLEIFPATLPKGKTTGLYHVAFVFETRKQFGGALRHLLKIGARLDGFSDHGTHEAIYLPDSEGNGVEIYKDKPQEEWLKEDGSVAFASKFFPMVEIFEQGTKTYDGFNESVKLGHVHLVVGSISETNNFYQDILGLTITNNRDSEATFLASGTYHHHIAGNTWSGEGLPKLVDGQQGLRMIRWGVKKQATFNHLVQTLDEHAYPYWIEDERIMVYDNSGLLLSIEVVKI
ncbi:VOC family protein [Tuanshanicoccus lijuaniae]|uniref:VOC family protein n=1 Tax=Aerococcaceae bacterium zg-1292 TaxID=2774330 RepID=UPI0019355A16|nr:VOC family protein [Aerococcaceae bacterium zg-1292]MBS4455483.1 VOC family protein [Aerococcaceae bacterium zg-A91]MBS4457102.1 VOC family protein [Aerococcaceae bacterium zg-BR33]QQA37876.1 VOC family protein [Aerococcaceae bacterium zg-1292]